MSNRIQRCNHHMCPGDRLHTTNCGQQLIMSLEEYFKSVYDDQFSVDEFVKEHTNSLSLEQLKDDLSRYLRSIHLSMIDLINQDYTDFINLSSNLIGVDKLINNLINPLQVFSDEIERIRSEIMDVISRADECLTSLKSVRSEKQLMERTINVMKGLMRVKQLIRDNHLDSKEHIDADLFLVFERIITELTTIQHELSLLNSPLMRSLEPQSEELVDIINNQLKHLFLNAINNQNCNEIDLVIKIYRLFGRKSELEKLFRCEIIRPVLKNIIEEDFNNDVVDEMFEKILNFVRIQHNLFSEEDFKYILKGIWQEMLELYSYRTPSLFSAGDPNHFHSSYIDTVKFINEFRSISNSNIPNRTEAGELLQKFNTQIYFHMRYQEIAEMLEHSLRKSISNLETTQNNSSSFKILQSFTFYESIILCWSTDKVFIDPLFYGFWKLSLQIFSRYTIWLNKLQLNDFKHGLENVVNECAKLFSLVNETKTGIKLIKAFFEGTILELKPCTINESELRESLDESIYQLNEEGLPNIIALIKSLLIKQCIIVLKQVNDIPRLYRKTNREVPTKPSSYVNTSLDLICDFLSTDLKDNRWNKTWTLEILEELTKQFKIYTSEVLTSVQKMEDSLRRLKKVKSTGNLKSNSTMSDDDKIRLQFYIDVESFGEKVRKLISLNLLSN